MWTRCALALALLSVAWSKNDTASDVDFDIDGLTEALLSSLAPQQGQGFVSTQQQFASFMSDAQQQASKPEILGALSSEFGTELAGLMAGLHGDPVQHTMQQVGQLGGFGTGGQALAAGGATVSQGISQIQAFADLMRGEVCTPAKVELERKVPAKIFGPVVNITLSLGNCTVVHDSEDDPKGKSIECTGPRLSYKKTPLVYVSKHKTPVRFTSGECLVSKTLGIVEEKSLYSAGPDVVFESLEEFGRHLGSGVLSGMMGFDPALQPGGPGGPVHMAQQPSFAGLFAGLQADPQG